MLLYSSHVSIINKNHSETYEELQYMYPQDTTITITIESTLTNIILLYGRRDVITQHRRILTNINRSRMAFIRRVIICYMRIRSRKNPSEDYIL